MPLFPRQVWIRYLATWAAALPIEDVEELGALASDMLTRHLSDPNAEHNPVAAKLKEKLLAGGVVPGPPGAN